jgi:hypothetical protein
MPLYKQCQEIRKTISRVVIVVNQAVTRILGLTRERVLMVKRCNNTVIGSRL